MNVLDAGNTFPRLAIPELKGGMLTLGEPRGNHDWQMVVVYRGLHCPICKKYLATLEGLVPEFAELGVDVVTVSGDPLEKARQMAQDQNLSLAIGYDLSVTQMRELGLFVSDPRSPLETDRPFAEPGLFVINAEGDIQIIDLSNAPFARPDLQSLLNGVKFIRDKDYPLRGTHDDT